MLPRPNWRICGTLTAAFVLLLISVPGPQAQTPPSVVRIDKVKAEPLLQTVPVIGRIVARRTGNVATRIGGLVMDVGAEVGDRVKQGQIIAALDNEALKAEQLLARSELVEAEADYMSYVAEEELSRIDVRRQNKLKRSSAFSQARFEDAEQKLAVAATKVKKAEAAIMSKKAALARKKLDVDHATIRAPYSGVVMERFAEVGSYVGTGASLFKILSVDSLEIEADIPFRRIGGVDVGRLLDIELDDGSRHRASVRAVLPEENSLTRTRTVLLVPDFKTINKPLAQGQSVTVAVPLGEQRTVLSVHKDAVLKRTNADQVVVIVDGKAQIRNVTLGESVGTRVEVLSGLTEGQDVVVRGNERLRPGVEVSIETGAS